MLWLFPGICGEGTGGVGTGSGGCGVTEGEVVPDVAGMVVGSGVAVMIMRAVVGRGVAAGTVVEVVVVTGTRV
jgi:hypothetical protein